VHPRLPNRARLKKPGISGAGVATFSKAQNILFEVGSDPLFIRVNARLISLQCADCLWCGDGFRILFLM
jgi:hypothetical protein